MIDQLTGMALQENKLIKPQIEVEAVIELFLLQLMPTKGALTHSSTKPKGQLEGLCSVQTHALIASHGTHSRWPQFHSDISILLFPLVL
jgi:hypothetical protein